METQERLEQKYKRQMKALMRQFSTEERLEGIPVRERLAGIPVREWLAGIPQEDVVKELPVDVRLSGLPPEALLRGLTPSQRRMLARLLSETDQASPTDVEPAE